jgi:WD40 repeat protein
MRNRLQLLPMTGSQAFDAVYGSASHLMSDDTAEQVVRFVASEKHAGPAADDTETPLDDLVVEPALLSLVCRGLNESRKLRRDSGGPNRIDGDLLASTGAGVVDWHYDTCMRDQPDRVHRFVECELITESGFRKPCAQDDAQREPYGVALDSLRSLVDRRLLRIEPSLGVTRVELIHDLLTPTVVARRDARRGADRKRQLDDELKKQEAERQSADAAQRARRRMQIVAALAGGAVLVAVAVAALAVYAVRQAHLATAESERASAQARVAQSRELASAATTRLDLDAELAVRLALEAAKVSPTVQAESALRQALFRWRGRGAAPSLAREGAPRSLPVRELKGHTDDVMSVAFSPDGSRLLSVSCDRTARLWNVANGTEQLVLRDHRASLSVGVFSRDGHAIVTAGGNPCITKTDRTDPNDTDVRVWDADTGQVTARLSGSPNLLVSAAFNADRSEVAAGGIDGQLLTWTLATRAMRVVGAPSQGLQSIEYSPDGSQLASGGLDGKVIVRNARSGETLAELRHNDGVLAIAYGGTAQTGVLLVSADLKGIAKVWDARTLKLRREVNSYSAALNATALSRDSRFLVTAGADLLIWDIETGARLQALSRPGGLYAASMSANGQMIAIGGPGGFVALLDCDVCVPLEQLMKLATERSPREFTEQERKDFVENGSQGGRP